ncbi:hypothetical protein MmmBen181_0274 [Mycoplasma mycoides subsp. mycoides]|nr:hypothetical protein MmmBen181_0274 [Mycoplasma mycoides subsp. mycoides]
MKNLVRVYGSGGLLTSFSLLATSSVLVVSCKTVDIKKYLKNQKV